MSQYTALIVDIKKSRQFDVGERTRIQNYIIECINVLNRLFKPSLAFDVVFSAGDEFQGLFTKPAAAFLYYQFLDTLIFPVQTRAGIGVGEWTVKVVGGKSTEQDGSAFHNARQAIEKTNKGAGEIAILSENREDIFLNEYFTLKNILYMKLTRKQRQLLIMSEIMYPIGNALYMDMAIYPEIYRLVDQHKMFVSEEASKENRPYDMHKIRLREPVAENHIVDENRLVYFQKQKGLPAELAVITGKTRQNMESILKAGNLTKIRDLHLVILAMMDRIQ